MRHWTQDCGDPHAEIAAHLGRVRDLPVSLSLQQPVPGMMQRECEVALTVQIAEDIKAKMFIDVGTGAGQTTQRVHDTMGDDCSIVGFDWKPRGPFAISSKIEHWYGDLFADDAATLRKMVAQAERPLFVYCDNGHKIRELDIVSEHMCVGDVIGCHDYGTEVPHDSVPFLAERGFEVMEDVQRWIEDTRCLQQFWKKVR